MNLEDDLIRETPFFIKDSPKEFVSSSRLFSGDLYPNRPTNNQKEKACLILPWRTPPLFGFFSYTSYMPFAEDCEYILYFVLTKSRLVNHRIRDDVFSFLLGVLYVCRCI